MKVGASCTRSCHLLTWAALVTNPLVFHNVVIILVPILQLADSNGCAVCVFLLCALLPERRTGSVVVAGRVIIAGLVGWTGLHVSAGMLECHSCHRLKVMFLAELSIKTLQSPQGSFIAVRIPGIACGIQTAAIPKSFCLLKSLFTGWFRSLQEILHWRRKFVFFVSPCILSLLGVQGRV